MWDVLSGELKPFEIPEVIALTKPLMRILWLSNCLTWRDVFVLARTWPTKAPLWSVILTFPRNFEWYSSSEETPVSVSIASGISVREKLGTVFSCTAYWAQGPLRNWYPTVSSNVAIGVNGTTRSSKVATALCKMNELTPYVFLSICAIEEDDNPHQIVA